MQEKKHWQNENLRI